VSRLRSAAAAWVEHGRWLGRVEAYSAAKAALERAGKAPAATVWNAGLDLEADACATNAATARREAEALMAALEHPGARLARRIVTAARAARAAWRASR